LGSAVPAPSAQLPPPDPPVRRAPGHFAYAPWPGWSCGSPAPWFFAERGTLIAVRVRRRAIGSAWAAGNPLLHV